MQPLFIKGRFGSLFAIFWPPMGQIKHHKAILHATAFADEMNKSRRMIALQARAFAEQGVAVLVLDLFGTGDSEGDFSDATWSIWLQDVACGLDWLRERYSSLCLWGHRCGALLALDFLHQFKPLDVSSVLLWQPVLSGEAFVLQFLRLRVAAAMMNPQAPQEKTSTLKQQLQNGQVIEVAGYRLNPDLMNPLVALKAGHLLLPQDIDYRIVELLADENATTGHALNRWLDDLRDQHVAVDYSGVIGSAFWSSQEIVCVPELIDVSLKHLVKD